MVVSKEKNLQKQYLKLICKGTYYFGLGDCWYEKTERGKVHRILYFIWAVIINSYIILTTVNEVAGNFRSDLSPKDKTDVVQFSLAHPSLVAKYLLLILQKDRVRMLLERLIEGTRPIFSSQWVDRQSVRRGTQLCVTIMVISIFTIALSTIDSIISYYKEGTPMRTEVVYYPNSKHTGLLNNILKVFVHLHWWCIVANMIIVDSISLFSMVLLRYKFKIVKMYFKSLSDKVHKNRHTMSLDALTEEFEKDFIVGIKIHEDALWCAKNVQYALGNVYSVQVFESITLIVMCLIKTVASEKNLSFLMANFFYLLCILALTGGYFTAGGDVTDEAADVGTWMFWSGWELVAQQRRLRTLVVVAIQRSHRPVILTAFGVINLSHRNLISMVRSSYSFFAVMY